MRSGNSFKVQWIFSKFDHLSQKNLDKNSGLFRFRFWLSKIGKVWKFRSNFLKFSTILRLIFVFFRHFWQKPSIFEIFDKCRNFLCFGFAKVSNVESTEKFWPLRDRESRKAANFWQMHCLSKNTIKVFCYYCRNASIMLIFCVICTDLK